MVAVDQQDMRALVAQLQKEIEDIRRGNRSNMPVGTSVIEEVDAFAWCPDPLCEAGSEQRPVRAFRETRSYTCGDRNRGLAGKSALDFAFDRMVENTYSYLRFADEADAYCECGRMLELSEQVRPTYAMLSGHDPDALRKRMKGQLPDWKEGGEGSDELKQHVARMEGQIAAMMAMLSGKPIEADVMIAAGASMVEAANGTPKGIVRRGEKFEALLYKTESVDGKQHSLGRFDSQAEAEAERTAGLDRVAAVAREAVE